MVHHPRDVPLTARKRDIIGVRPTKLRDYASAFKSNVNGNGLRIRSVTIGKEKRLAVDPPGVLVSEIFDVVDYAFPCRPKPRMTWGSRWRHQEYFAWVEQVRAWSGSVKMQRSADLILVIRGGLRSNSDGANAYKAVEDALCGIAYADDNLKHVRRGVWCYEDADVPGFTVILAR